MKRRGLLKGRQAKAIEDVRRGKAGRPTEYWPTIPANAAGDGAWGRQQGMAVLPATSARGFTRLLGGRVDRISAKCGRDQPYAADGDDPGSPFRSGGGYNRAIAPQADLLGRPQMTQ